MLTKQIRLNLHPTHTMKKKIVGLFILITLFISPINLIHGQINLTGTSYVQSFDTISTSGLPNGITVRTGSTAAVVGTIATFSNAAVAWNNTSGAFKNFASAIFLRFSYVFVPHKIL